MSKHGAMHRRVTGLLSLALGVPLVMPFATSLGAQAAVVRDSAARRNAPARAPERKASATRDTASREPRYRYTVVTYLSGDLIYLDAGTVAGLREKSSASVMRRDTVFAQLEVQFVSSSRAAARITQGTGVVIGDSVRFLPATDAVVTASPVSAGGTTASGASANGASASGASASGASARDMAATTSTTSAVPATSSSTAATAAPNGAASTSARRPTARTVNGRLGLRYMSLVTGSGANGKLTQPAVDLRIDGHHMSGSPLGMVIDARAHRQRAANGRVDGSTRVYQSLIEFQATGAFPVRVSAGRQLSTVLSPLGFFDGLTMDVDRRTWRFGALGGTQPDYVNFAPSAAIREAGAWVQWHNAPGTRTLLQTTLGGVGSYGVSGINREFALLTSTFVAPQLSWYATQEVDINRGWRRSAEGGRELTPTSTFATMRVTLPRGFAVNGGYDSRRNVRVYRDFLTPDIAFDDALRRGYWGGVSLSAPHVYGSVDVRTSDGSTVGRNQSNTAMLSLTRFTRLGLGLRARSTMYHGPTVTGQVTSASLEANPLGRIRLEGTLGKREDRHAQTGMIPARTTWVGLDADAGLGRSWYVMLSSYREVGDTDRLLQQYAALSWRF